MQVAENGDLANWMIPGKMVRAWAAPWIVAGVQKVVVVMEHSARTRPSSSRCTLPLTGAGVVDMVITDPVSSPSTRRAVAG